MTVSERVFAALYNPIMRVADRAGLAEHRRSVVASASGRVLEIGAGTGGNLGYYSPAATEILLTEPSEPMVAKLEAALRAHPGLPASVTVAGADALPVDGASVDTVVSTLVLCTVPDPRSALREVARILKPRGRLVFCEHVRSDDPRLARWQDRLMRPWRVLGQGCTCNRETLPMIREVLTVEHVRDDVLPKAPPLVRPLIIGSAVRT